MPVPSSKVTIVGAGPVGALAAIYLAQRGWNVAVYEQRVDITRAEHAHLAGGRSINLALSERGLEALRGPNLGLEVRVLSQAIPMKGRMIHKEGGRLESQLYGVHGEYINSVDRAKLNVALLQQLAKLPNVELHFEHKLKKCNLDAGTCEFDHKGTTVVVKDAGWVIGADGAYSNVRSALMRYAKVNFSQEYIPHLYCELTIPPKDGEFAMDANHLHIWPKQTFMLIALPNQDKSFTCTLFMPQEKFRAIQTAEDVVALFTAHFPDALALIGRDKLVQDYFANPKGSLVSVKCKPYHYKDKALIIGDAAHSMVPFYGQGMNAGFQDVTTLARFLDTCSDLHAALREYTEYRHPDATTACDLAMYNYIEMRALVRNPWHLLRRSWENTLYRYGLFGVVPLYTMVSFSTMRYSEARAKWKRQGRWFVGSMVGLCAAAAAAGGWRALQWLGAGSADAPLITTTTATNTTTTTTTLSNGGYEEQVVVFTVSQGTADHVKQSFNWTVDKLQVATSKAAQATNDFLDWLRQ